MLKLIESPTLQMKVKNLTAKHNCVPQQEWVEAEAEEEEEEETLSFTRLQGQVT
jgi:hypothetical protein